MKLIMIIITIMLAKPDMRTSVSFILPMIGMEGRAPGRKFSSMLVSSTRQIAMPIPRKEREYIFYVRRINLKVPMQCALYSIK